MMNRKEFEQYIADHVRDYLPPSYDDAQIRLQEVVKNNDQQRTGLLISRPGENIAPNIYLDELFERYQAGENIDQLAGAAADIRIEHENSGINPEIAKELMDYANVQDKLQIRLCDPEENQERLKDLVYTMHGDFAATYHINLVENEAGYASVAVREDFMKIWGITAEQLHADALECDRARIPCLYDVNVLMESMMMGGETPPNLLDTDGVPMDNQLFCFTNQEKVNGASMILQDDVMDKIGSILGGNYYVLPSSIHETLVIADTPLMDVRELSEMVYQINRSQVIPEERLSDKVQYYDTDTHTLENALDRQERLDMEKSGKEAGKEKTSIHQRLSENKEKSLEMVAKAAPDKAHHKNHGAEL